MGIQEGQRNSRSDVQVIPKQVIVPYELPKLLVRDRLAIPLFDYSAKCGELRLFFLAAELAFRHLRHKELVSSRRRACPVQDRPRMIDIGRAKRPRYQRERISIPHK